VTRKAAGGLGAIWRRRSFTAKFAFILLITAVLIGVLPLSVSTTEAKRQSQARATDKAGLILNLVQEQRRSMQDFIAALGVQVSSAVVRGDDEVVLRTLVQDSHANAPSDIVGALSVRGSIVIRDGVRLADPALTGSLTAAVAQLEATAADPQGHPWLIVRDTPAVGVTLFAARPLDAATVQALTRTVGTSGDPSSIAIARGGHWVLDGALGGASVPAGSRQPEDLVRMGGAYSAVLGIDGHDLGVASVDLGCGFVAVVSTPVAQVTTFWEPALLLIALILLAMIGIILVVRTDLQAPLRRLDRAVAALGQGDFDVAIPTAGNDEIGRLGRSFDTVRRELQVTLRTQSARATIAAQLSAPQPLETALTAVARELREATGSAASMILVSGSEMSDSLTISSGIDVNLDAMALLASDGPLGMTFRAPGLASREIGAAPSSLEATLGVREFCAAPLRIGIHTFGVIAVAAGDGDFHAVHRAVVESTAEQVALALERYRFLALVQRQASIDDLTGLYNHRFLIDYLAQQVAITERTGAALAVLMLDLDNFKTLNDTHGHHAGDEALRTFARTLTGLVRRADLAARYGGEEFIVIMANTGGKEAALVAEKIRAAVERAPVNLGPAGSAHVTVSIGAVAYPEHSTSAHDLIMLADRALYAAKNSGRNRVCMAEEVIPSISVHSQAQRQRTGPRRRAGAGQPGRPAQ